MNVKRHLYIKLDCHGHVLFLFFNKKHIRGDGKPEAYFRHSGDSLPTCPGQCTIVTNIEDINDLYNHGNYFNVTSSVYFSSSLLIITDLHDSRHHCAPQRPPSLALENLLQFEVDSSKVLPDVVPLVDVATHGTLAGIGVVESREALLDLLLVVSCNHVRDELGHILRIRATDLANLKMMTMNNERFKTEHKCLQQQ